MNKNVRPMMGDNASNVNSFQGKPPQMNLQNRPPFSQASLNGSSWPMQNTRMPSGIGGPPNQMRPNFQGNGPLQPNEQPGTRPGPPPNSMTGYRPTQPSHMMGGQTVSQGLPSQGGPLQNLGPKAQLNSGPPMGGQVRPGGMPPMMGPGINRPHIQTTGPPPPMFGASGGALGHAQTSNVKHAPPGMPPVTIGQQQPGFPPTTSMPNRPPLANGPQQPGIGTPQVSSGPSQPGPPIQQINQSVGQSGISQQSGNNLFMLYNCLLKKGQVQSF